LILHIYKGKRSIIKMKKIIALIACLAIILTSLAFVSCGRSLKYEDGYYYCAQNGVTYQMVSFEYAPIAIGKEYATLRDGLIDNVLYEIQNADPEKWLSTADGNLFCSVDETIPTVDEMEIDSVLVCYESVAIISLATITDTDDVAAILDNFANGNTVEYPIGDEKEEFLKLRLASSKYPWLYYSLAYVEFVSDVCEYDYPADFDTYEYRDVSDDVKVTTYDEYECRYAVNSDDEEETYIDIAEKSGTRYITIKKPNVDGTFTDYVIYIFDEEKTTEECVASVIENYKNGSFTEDKLHSLLDEPTKAEKVNVVEYNYGKYFMYDRISGKCVKTGELIHNYKEGNTQNEATE